MPWLKQNVISIAVLLLIQLNPYTETTSNMHITCDVCITPLETYYLLCITLTNSYLKIQTLCYQMHEQLIPVTIRNDMN